MFSTSPRCSSDSRTLSSSSSPATSPSSSSAFTRANVERRRWRAAASSGLGDEPVANPTHRLDPARLLQRAPDLIRGLLQAVLEAGVRAAPNLLEHLLPGNHVAFSTREQLKHRHRTSLELQRPLAQGRLAFGRIDPEPSSHDHPISAGPLPQ